jgi:hypothetical protein
MAADMRKVAARGIGVVVEEHGHVVGLRPPPAEVACDVGCPRARGVGSTERDERDHVERPETRVHAVVARE